MRTVVVTTGSRLHFGLIVGGEPGALKFGGIGTMIDNPGWKIRVSHATGADHEIVVDDSISADDLPPVDKCVEAIRSRHVKKLRIVIESGIPRHVGLGSGTQFAYALNVAVQSLVEMAGRLRYDEATEAAQTQRGNRSRVGPLGFLKGGFIYNSLIRKDEVLQMPSAWRWVLVWPGLSKGMHGEREQQVFDEIRPMPPELVERLIRRIETGVLPAVRNQDFGEFESAIGRYGREVGEFYAAYQGNLMADREMLRLADLLAESGISGAAQSSWGPAIAIPASNETNARIIVERIRAQSNADNWVITVSGNQHDRLQRGERLEYYE